METARLWLEADPKVRNATVLHVFLESFGIECVVSAPQRVNGVETWLVCADIAPATVDFSGQ